MEPQQKQEEGRKEDPNVTPKTVDSKLPQQDSAGDGGRLTTSSPSGNTKKADNEETQRKQARRSRTRSPDNEDRHRTSRKVDNQQPPIKHG